MDVHVEAGDGHFEDVTAQAGLALDEMSRSMLESRFLKVQQLQRCSQTTNPLMGETVKRR